MDMYDRDNRLIGTMSRRLDSSNDRWLWQVQWAREIPGRSGTTTTYKIKDNAMAAVRAVASQIN